MNRWSQWTIPTSLSGVLASDPDMHTTHTIYYTPSIIKSLVPRKLQCTLYDTLTRASIHDLSFATAQIAPCLAAGILSSGEECCC